jgi:hypothetical protein
MGEEMRILSIRPCGTSRVLLHAVKSYDMGTFPLYFPSERKVCCGFLSPLKNPFPWPGSNPQPLGPVASTLTTTPPRRLSHLCLILSNSWSSDIMYVIYIYIFLFFHLFCLSIFTHESSSKVSVWFPFCNTLKEIRIPIRWLLAKRIVVQW